MNLMEKFTKWLDFPFRDLLHIDSGTALLIFLTHIDPFTVTIPNL